MKKLLMTAATLLALSSVAAAETCSGTLIHRDDGWFVEEEDAANLCEFRNRAMENRVRAVCSKDQGCIVTGTIINCKHDACRRIRSLRRVERVR
jgi:hypothetical protein